MYIIEKLREAKDFTSAEKALAEVILADHENALRMTLQDLAAMAFVSKPTVIRLYRKLGFESYSDFRLAYYAENTKLSTGEVINPNHPFPQHSTPKQIAERMRSLTEQVVDKCCMLIDEEQLNHTVSMLCDANRIFIFAIGDSYIQAKAFCNKLVKLNFYPILVNEIGDHSAHVFNITKDDHAIFVTFSGNLLKTQSGAVEACFKAQVPMTIITAMNDSALLSRFDSVLKLSGGEHTFRKMGTFASQIAISYIFNVLYGCIFETNYEYFTEQNNCYSQFITKYDDIARIEQP